MKNILRFPVLAGLFLLLFGGAAPAQDVENADKTLSPYFVVQGGEGVDGLPLKSTAAQVKIAGVIADVQVTQVYQNNGKTPLEAVYVFPASTRAAVYGMKMTIGERTIVAEIKKRDQARQEYETAKAQGKNASLLEQQRPNVFQMNVANIMPGDVVKVELKYTELLVPSAGTYEFVYPTVVGPRYAKGSSTDAPAADAWTHNPYQRQGEAPHYGFDISVNLSAGLPIQDILCPSHKTDISFLGKSLASVKLDPKETRGGNRDFILKYRLQGSKIQSGLLLYEDGKENYFLLMAQPPKRVTPEEIPGRDYVFIVDVSGSMNGFPLDISKKLMVDLLSGLRATDTFNILFFAGGNQALSETPLCATKANIQKAVAMMENQQGSGGTELLPALKRALALPQPEGVSRSVIVATDGYVDVEPEAFELVKKSLGQANLFAFGIGSSVNRFLIEGMARAGMGEPFIVTKPGEAPAQAEALRKMVSSPVLTDIRLSFGGFQAYDVEPASVPDIFAERPVVVFGKWRGKAHGIITLKGISGSGKYSREINVAKVEVLASNSALRYLWARHRIAALGDVNALRPDDKRVKQITDLGLEYNLLTAYTSFVAVDSQVRNKTGQSTTVKQPLPLPDGVSNLAVGGAAPQAMGYGNAVCSKAAPSLKRCETMKLSADASSPAESQEKETKTLSVLKCDGLVLRGGVKEKDFENWFNFNRAILEGAVGSDCTAFKVTLKVKVDGQGTVKSVEMTKTGKGCDQAAKRLEAALKSLNFPVPSGGRAYEVEFTLSTN
jgi:Ca-activated chloride channel homolog